MKSQKKKKSNAYGTFICNSYLDYLIEKQNFWEMVHEVYFYLYLLSWVWFYKKRLEGNYILYYLK